MSTVGLLCVAYFWAVIGGLYALVTYAPKRVLDVTFGAIVFVAMSVLIYKLAVGLL